MDSLPVKRPGELSVLGFDFGTRRIGVAFGQNITGTASPLEPIPARDGIPDWEQLDALVAHWQPKAFVVGLPYNMDDTESELLVRARKFGNRLNGRYHLPCYGMDERLSSFEARGQLLRHEAKGQLDCLAATLILDGWFQCLAEKFPPDTP
ncbi:MAG: Holliday junction resolvase RuvX [Gammaproteobacteria bacterium]